MYTYVLREYTDLRIPREKIAQMHENLAPRIEQTHVEPPFISVSSAKEKLLLLLRFAGYDASEEESGDIIIDDCTLEKLSTSDDPVLCALVGITPSESCLTLYGDDNSQWQVRYDETKKWTIRGKVVFPVEEGLSFPHEFLPGN